MTVRIVRKRPIRSVSDGVAGVRNVRAPYKGAGHSDGHPDIDR